MAEITSAEDQHSILIRRLGATLLDNLVLPFIIVVVNRILPNSLYGQWPWIGGIVAIALGLGYYIILEAQYGATLGKFWLRIRIVDSKGRRPTVKQAAIRTALRLVEVNPLFAGALPGYIAFRLSRHGQRLGDLLARTFVVRSGDVSLIRSGDLDVEAFSPAS